MPHRCRAVNGSCLEADQGLWPIYSSFTLMHHGLWCWCIRQQGSNQEWEVSHMPDRTLTASAVTAEQACEHEI